MKVVSLAIGYDCMAGIVASLGAGAQLSSATEDIDEFSFALIAPLGAKNDSRHGETQSQRANPRINELARYMDRGRLSRYGNPSSTSELDAGQSQTF